MLCNRRNQPKEGALNMPTLQAAQAAEVENAIAEGGGEFSALEPGVYTARLAKVEAKTASTGSPMWPLEFDQVRDLSGERKPGRLWTNLVMVDTAMWKVGQFFAAYGVPTTTNTDHLIGHRVRLAVETRVIGKGSREGKVGNEIGGFQSLAEGDDGYAELAKMVAKLKKESGAAAPKKAAAPKAEAPAADEAQANPGEAAAAPVSDDDIDF